jgi:putative acetyltransferase
MKINMIRESQQTDIEAIVNIWLSASIKAHDFMAPEYWKSKVEDMRNIYIPASETYVYEKEGNIQGFISIYQNSIAALFVNPDLQGKGVGSELIEFVKLLNKELSLCVYKSNTKSIAFYKKHGFQEVCKQVDEYTNNPEIMMKINS